MIRIAIVLVCVVLAPAVARAQPVPADTEPPLGSGVRIGITAGGAFETALGQTHKGGGGDISAGYELMRGMIGIEPFGDFGLLAFGGSGSRAVLSVIGGAQVRFHSGAWAPALSLGFGYGRSWNHGVSQSYFATSIGGELSHQITRWFALGIEVHYKPFINPQLTSFIDFGASLTITL
jgi:hypothetical protein